MTEIKRKKLTRTERVAVFKDNGGICDICGGKIVGKKWDVSHRRPLAMGGADDKSNWFPAHRTCHRVETATKDIPAIGEAKRRDASHIGVRKEPTMKSPKRTPAAPQNNASRPLAKTLPPPRPMYRSA